MKHQVLQVLILVVLTKADTDGHGSETSSSVLYPHTFFGEFAGKGSTNFGSGNQRLGSGNFGRSRSGKSLNLDAVPIEHPQTVAQLQHQPLAQHTFFGAPLTNRQGRIGSTNPFKSLPQDRSQVIVHKPQSQLHEDVQRQVQVVPNQQFDANGNDVRSLQQVHDDVQHQVSAVPAPPIQNVQIVKPQRVFEFRNSRNEVRNFQQIHEEIQALRDAKKVIQPNIERVVQDEQRHIQVQNQQRDIQLQNQQREIELQNQQREIQLQNQQREIQLQNQQRAIQEQNLQRERQNLLNALSNRQVGSGFQPVKNAFVHHEIPNQNRFQNRQVNILASQHPKQNEIPNEQRFKVNEEGFRSGKSDSLESSSVNAQQQSTTIFGITPSNRQSSGPLGSGLISSGNRKSGNFVSSGRIGKSNSFDSPVSTPEVKSPHHHTFFGAPATNRQTSARIGSVHGNSQSGRIGKSNSFDSLGGILGAKSLHPHTFFGAPASNRQTSARFGSGLGNSQAGNFFSSSRIGKSNSLEESQNRRQFPIVPAFVSPIHEAQGQEAQVAHQVREGKADSVKLPSSFRHPLTFFGATPLNRKSSNNFGNFVSAGRLGKANSLEIPHTQKQPLVIQTSQEQVTIISPQEQRIQIAGNQIQNRQQNQFFQNTPIQIQSLPNIRPEVRGVLGQTQRNIQPSKQGFQRGSQIFPKPTQNNRGLAQENLRPIQEISPSNQVFGRASQNAQLFPQPAQNNRGISLETVRPISNFKSSSQVFGRGSQNVQIVPQPIPNNRGLSQVNGRPSSQEFVKESQNVPISAQPIQISSGSSQVKLRPFQDVRSSSQVFGRGSQNGQLFAQPTQNNRVISQESVSPIQNIRSSSQVFGRGSQNLQIVPQQIQNNRVLSQENGRPIQNVGPSSQVFFKESQNVPIIAQPIQISSGSSQENLRTIQGVQPSSQGFQRGSENVFPQPIQINQNSSPQNVIPIQDVPLSPSSQPNQQSLNSFRPSFFGRPSFFDKKSLETNEV